MLLHSDLLHALDAATFAEDALGFELDGWQCDALRSPARRQIWNITRQGGKSTIASIIATHTVLFTPASLTLLISPSLRQSSELFRKVAGLMDALKQRPSLVEDNKLSMTLPNQSRVISLPSSESTVRGFSAVNLIIEDEASRVGDDLHVAIRPMLATSDGRLILMSTPAGRRGHFHDLWENGTDAWQRTMITADACPRIPRWFLDEERATLGERWFRQEYQGSFEETEGALFDYATIAAAITDDIAPLFGGDR
jgi:hypothetical protein